MAKQPRVWTGTQWDTLAVTLPDLSNYSTTTQMNTAIDNAKGMVLISTNSFTTASSVQFDNVFTSTYDNYFVTLRLSAASSDSEIRFKFVDGTTPTTSQDYYWAWTGTYINNGGAVYNYTGTGGTTYATLTDIRTSEPGQWGQTLTILNPNLAQKTNYSHQGIGRNVTYLYNAQGAGVFNVNTVFEGIQFYPSAGTITGTIRIYGYRNS